MDVIDCSVVRAKVSHVRRVPVGNRFVYRTDYLLLHEAVLAGGPSPKLFSFGRPNLVSLYPSDHGVAGCRGPEGFRRLVRNAGIKGDGCILLLTHPRHWGYTFNPVSFWFLLGTAGNLRAVLAEVHNTFGDRHGYLCAGENGSDLRPDAWIELRKQFHVSPFFEIAGAYRFRFLLDEARIGVRIVYDDGAGGGLHTTLVGARRPFTNRELVRSLLIRPLGAARTTALIHWQAFRLWRKGVPYHRRIEPPEHGIS